MVIRIFPFTFLFLLQEVRHHIPRGVSIFHLAPFIPGGEHGHRGAGGHLLIHRAVLLAGGRAQVHVGIAILNGFPLFLFDYFRIGFWQ